MPSEDDAVRYRRAADMALDQLDWCAEYFRTIRKPRLAKQVARNRATIARRIQEASDEARARAQR
jgi:hypothetical protein